MKKISIIGAGISGLCAGSYLQMNGYDTEIFELNNLPGGLLTAWKRKEYTFDGCIHFLAGSSPSDPFYHLWNELIDMSSIKFVDPDRQFRFISSEGEVLNLYCDIEKLEKELMEVQAAGGASRSRPVQPTQNSWRPRKDFSPEMKKQI